jgi:hypothetical protein
MFYQFMLGIRIETRPRAFGCEFLNVTTMRAHKKIIEAHPGDFSAKARGQIMTHFAECRRSVDWRADLTDM